MGGDGCHGWAANKKKNVPYGKSNFMNRHSEGKEMAAGYRNAVWMTSTKCNTKTIYFSAKDGENAEKTKQRYHALPI